MYRNTQFQVEVKTYRLKQRMFEIPSFDSECDYDCASFLYEPSFNLHPIFLTISLRLCKQKLTTYRPAGICLFNV